jgi:hypothetical protein
MSKEWLKISALISESITKWSKDEESGDIITWLAKDLEKKLGKITIINGDEVQWSIKEPK